MSNYIKATSFASKDELPVGNPNKKVKGVEIDNEFNAIANSVSTKADLQSPTFSGTPAVSGTTPVASTSTTQIATTAFVQSALGQSSIINTAQIADDAVTGAKLATNSVTADAIAANAVGSSEIASDAVGSTQIADSVALGGNPTTTTQASNNNSTRIATTAMVQSAIAANAYTLPSATSSTLGGIKIYRSGTTLYINT